MKLSRRLTQILEKIPRGSRLADIGSDHALLPVAAVESGAAIQAIAGEVNPGPYDAAVKQVIESGMTEVISVRRGDGLNVLSVGEADVITIAGMGGSLIAAILDRGIDKLTGVRRLVLQPNVGEDILRKWLYSHGWVLIEEWILEEDGKIYEVLVAEPSHTTDLTNEQVYKDRAIGGGLRLSTDWLFRMGPWLTQSPNPVFYDKWKSEIEKMEYILQSLSRSDLTTAADKASEIRSDIEFIQEVLACLPKDKP
ncbi:tRNA (adenine(22)-N(1))-methyltransferase TrmK [Paenibacillus sp. p3-SID867]|uniref:tRNA (adenine(22)-N(1))-methyltransferase n=1 Tax=Paenibacillus sp. p3-SID867 TaxID=2916363 RepID=UPI0021A846C0|nr:tRNA (adenine(22)-N(1))-methyltransferase TrmK [Paenibacillus sp. p3-SID867]MCT1397795.1 tRNA (adenine(22)-N(1))-methyltransferase TrmK [Paenibacillus sp. p3-SID867]